MQQNDSAQQVLSYNSKMLGSEIYVIKNGGWRGKVEEVIDEEYFLVSRFGNPSSMEKVSMYDIRSLSYETFWHTCLTNGHPKTYFS